jgi:hypothetical protein
MEKPFDVADNDDFNWSDKILAQLTLQRNAAQYNNTKLYESISKERESYNQTRKCIAAQKKIIFFASKRKADNQLKTYLLSPHMLDINTETIDLCYKGQKLFTKSMLEHFPASHYTLTWFYHA